MKTRKYTWKAVLLTALMMSCVAFSFTSSAQGPKLETVLKAEIAAIPAVGNAGRSGRPDTANGAQIAALACQYVGNPYRYGGTDLDTGVDCSGFVQAVYGKAGVNLPRTMDEMAKLGTKVSAENLAAGDLVFYGKNQGDDAQTPAHMALSIGNGQVIHASNARDGVKISEYNYREILSINRILQ